jgi:hypothetical protein
MDAFSFVTRCVSKLPLRRPLRRRNLDFNHKLTTAQKGKRKVYTVFPDLFAAYDSAPRERLWRHLQQDSTVLRNIIQNMYTGCLYLLLIIDGEISEKMRPTEA